MTIEEVAGLYAVAVAELTEALNIPADYASEKLGRLRRAYGFEMTEVKVAVERLREK
jgi:hypothetical protein